MRTIYLLSFLFLMFSIHGMHSQVKAIDYQTILDEAVKQGLPAIVAAVHAPNEALWTGKAGFSNFEHKTELDIDESFRLASITKLFTSIIILQLVDEKKIKLSDPISTYLDAETQSKISNSDQINTLQLLSHSSGMYSFTENNRFWKNCFFEGGMSRTWTPEQVLSYIENKKPESEPLEPFDKKLYSNTNYIVLGMIIENITGNSLSTAYQERIFDPLNMNHSFLEGFDTQNRKAIDSYAIPNSYFLKTATKRKGIKKLRADKLINLSSAYKLFNSWAWAAGGISTNINDLMLFFTAVKQGQLLSTDTQKILVDLYSAEDDGINFFGATGGSDGIQATMLHLMPQDVSILILINSSGHKNVSLGAVFKSLLKTATRSQ